jgi:hypothetical protein
MDNQRIIQSTPAIFFIQVLNHYVVITVEKVRAPYAGRRSGAPNMYWPHIWWLRKKALIVMSVDFLLQLLSIALIAESLFYVKMTGFPR